MYRLILVLIFLITLGCRYPIVIEPPDNNGKSKLISSNNKFRKSPYNRYMIVIKGKNSIFSGERCDNDLLDAKSIEVNDDYVYSDIREITKLGLYKNYDIYIETCNSELSALLDNIEKVSNSSTRVVIAMSGECDEKGFNINLVHCKSLNLVPPDKKIYAKEFIAHLGLISGTKALLISGCQSGCFTDAARKDPAFKGVVIAACRVGYATTQCERFGTSALYAGILRLYVDEPALEHNIAFPNKISEGSFIENIRHKLADIGAGGLSISYDPDVYATEEFWF